MRLSCCEQKAVSRLEPVYSSAHRVLYGSAQAVHELLPGMSHGPVRRRPRFERDDERLERLITQPGADLHPGLAAAAGLPLNEHGFVVVDEYMRMSDPSILAIGDCAEKRDFITRRPSTVMLASTACAEARVAATNLYELCMVKAFGGTIAVYSTALGATGFGTAGLTATAARGAGMQIVTGAFTGVDRHPGSLDQSHKQMVTLVAARDSGTLVGGSVVGGSSAGEITNVIGLAVQNRMTICDLLASQIGTHPCLTVSPAAYPLIKAAEVADAARRTASRRETHDRERVVA